MSGGTFTGGSADLGGTTFPLAVSAGSLQPVTLSGYADGSYTVAVTVMAQSPAGEVSSVSGSCNLIVCRAPPTIISCYYPKSDGKSVEMELPAADSGRFVFLNGNPEQGVFGNLLLRQMRFTPFFGKSYFTCVVAVSSPVGLSRTASAQIVKRMGYGGTRDLTGLSVQGENGLLDRLTIGDSWASATDAVDSSQSCELQVTLKDACGNSAASRTVFRALVNGSRPRLKGDEPSVDVLTRAGWVDRIDGLPQTPVYWIGGSSAGRLALEIGAQQMLPQPVSTEQLVELDVTKLAAWGGRGLAGPVPHGSVSAESGAWAGCGRPGCLGELQRWRGCARPPEAAAVRAVAGGAHASEAIWGHRQL